MDVCILSKHSNTELHTEPLHLLSHSPNDQYKSGYKEIPILGSTNINQNKRLYFFCLIIDSRAPQIEEISLDESVEVGKSLVLRQTPITLDDSSYLEVAFSKQPPINLLICILDLPLKAISSKL